jgi:hypothetical protein
MPKGFIVSVIILNRDVPEAGPSVTTENVKLPF